MSSAAVSSKKVVQLVCIHCLLFLPLFVGFLFCYTVLSVISSFAIAVLKGHPKTDKTKVLKTNGSLMKVESIAE